MYCTFKTASLKIVPISIIYNFKNLENWLENPRIISAPGLTEYKQKCYLFFYELYLRMYTANKGVVVVLLQSYNPCCGWDYTYKGVLDNQWEQPVLPDLIIHPHSRRRPFSRRRCPHSRKGGDLRQWLLVDGLRLMVRLPTWSSSVQSAWPSYTFQSVLWSWFW